MISRNDHSSSPVDFRTYHCPFNGPGRILIRLRLNNDRPVPFQTRYATLNNLAEKIYGSG